LINLHSLGFHEVQLMPTHIFILGCALFLAFSCSAFAQKTGAGSSSSSSSGGSSSHTKSSSGSSSSSSSQSSSHTSGSSTKTDHKDHNGHRKDGDHDGHNGDPDHHGRDDHHDHHRDNDHKKDHYKLHPVRPSTLVVLERCTCLDGTSWPKG